MSRLPVVLACGLAAAAARGWPAEAPLSGYVATVAPESPDAARQRHARVAARREREDLIIVHRGAAAAAQENTLEACAAAMEMGADGCEIDIRRTADGVLVLFHDDMLDRLTTGFGTVSQVTCYELLGLRPRLRYGPAMRRARPPTLASMLELARRTAMLLHLDVKEPDLDAEIAGLLTRADVWDHVVAVNAENAPQLSRDPRVRRLRYRGPGLYEGRRDLDPGAVRAQMAQPGQMIMVDDPRVAVWVRGARPAGPGWPLRLEDLRRSWAPLHASGPAHTAPLNAAAFAREARRRLLAPGEVERVLGEPDLATRAAPFDDPVLERRRTEAILLRAVAAQVAAERGKRSPELVRLLEFQVRNRSLHRDWMYHGLDGAMAARALGALGATRSAPVLVAAFRRVDPELSKVADPRFSQYPLSWTDFRMKLHLLPALGELKCAASRTFLHEYVRLPEPAAREMGPPSFEEATRALFRQSLSRSEIEELLRSENRAVAGTALLECLDNPDAERAAALRAVAPWALELPRAPRSDRRGARRLTSSPRSSPSAGPAPSPAPESAPSG